MQQFVIMGGLPGSGKSTLARELRGEGVFVVSADQIRVALNAGFYPSEAFGDYVKLDPVVWKVAELAVRELLAAGHSAAIDATNLTREKRAHWANLAREVKAGIHIVIRWCDGNWDSPERWEKERGILREEHARIRAKLESTLQLPQPDEANEVRKG